MSPRPPRPRMQVVKRRATPPMASAAGVSRAEILAAAAVGRRVLLAGGLEAARRIFEGLTALDPNEAHHAVALGLTYDRLGRTELAHRWYARAAQLDPRSALADVNRAELFLAAGDRTSAQKLLARAVQRAADRPDDALSKKARSMLENLK